MGSEGNGADGEQLPLIEVPPDWQQKWQGMPAYEHEDLEPWQSVRVHFKTREARAFFGELIQQRLTDQTRSIWYPSLEIARYMDRRYRSAEPVAPRYPIYIVSKGRAESRLTSRALEALGVPYYIVIEPPDYPAYAAVIDPAKILTLPFADLGEGSIPARNWIWEHSLGEGAARHWILDDNIDLFLRYQNNLKCPVATGVTFRAIEDFSDRFLNVALAGMQYFMFVSRKSGTIPPLTMDTRIYSCILIDNALPFRWRGRYNEDTDLSLRVLKDGRCTVLFNAFLARKMPTMSMPGGNTATLYQGDGRREMAESLREQHPDVTTITWKWNRWQHQVNYAPFRRNRLIANPAATPTTEDPYGLYLDVD